ncbi:single-stranded DNA-binding protein [Streptacidiphilus sp. EB129]|uniref:single-stranded DNA-binding protein n=1 Tax=Streptacidiphilus sp. EB129 TaxID=3156262 RepID=UPI003515F20D
MPRSAALPVADAPSPATRPLVPVCFGQPALLVLQATVVEPDGTTGHLALAMPAVPFGTQPWQLFALLTYLHQLRESAQDPTAASLRAHLAGPVPVPLPTWHYPYLVLHDPRVTTLIDVALGPRDTSRWPGVSVTVLEQERGGCSPFSRIRHHHGARALAAHTALELHCERDHLASTAQRTTSPALRASADLAHRLAERAQEIEQAARADRHRCHADQARSALQTTGTAAARSRFAPPPAARAELAGEPGALRALTGTVTRAPELRLAGGIPVARLQVAVDPDSNHDPDGLAQLAVCTLTGQAARNAATDRFAVGTRVVIAGTVTLHHYTRPADGIPHTAVSLDVVAIGPDLARTPPVHTAPTR